MGLESICEKCEEMLQPFLDRELDESERREAEAHLVACEYCAKRYHFEQELRRVVRHACAEPMPAELRAKLSGLRTPL